MADSEQISIFKEGTEAWNSWRARFPAVRPDLSGADLRNLQFSFHDAKGQVLNLQNADLRETDFSGGVLGGADFRETDARSANFRSASLRKTQWNLADAREAIFTDADFHRAFLGWANFAGADLSGASLDVRSARGTNFANAHLRGFKCEVNTYAIDWSVYATELLYAEGLPEVHADSQNDIAQYLQMAFEYIHSDDLRQCGISLEDMAVELARIQPLLKLYSSGRDEPEHERTAIILNDELIAFFRAHPDKVRTMNWRTFEHLMADILASHGWQVDLTRHTKDGGYDIFGVHTDSLGIRHTWIVECKRWDPTRPVGVDVVRSLYAVKCDLRVAGALLATTSHFTHGVKAFKASRYDLELKDHSAILEWINASAPKETGVFAVRNNRIVVDRRPEDGLR